MTHGPHGDTPVVTDDDPSEDSVLTFHDPEMYPEAPFETRVETTAQQARSEGAVACHECYGESGNVPAYEFPYLSRGGVGA